LLPFVAQSPMTGLAEKLPVETILTKGRRSALPAIQGLLLERPHFSALLPFDRR